jgi:hypothetical protein
MRRLYANYTGGARMNRCEDVQSENDMIDLMFLFSVLLKKRSGFLGNYTPSAQDGIDISHCLSDPPTISRSDFLFWTALPISRYTYIMSAFHTMGLASPQTNPRGSGEVPRVAPLIVVDLNQLIS